MDTTASAASQAQQRYSLRTAAAATPARPPSCLGPLRWGARLTQQFWCDEGLLVVGAVRRRRPVGVQTQREACLPAAAGGQLPNVEVIGVGAAAGHALASQTALASHATGGAARRLLLGRLHLMLGGQLLFLLLPHCRLQHWRRLLSLLLPCLRASCRRACCRVGPCRPISINLCIISARGRRRRRGGGQLCRLLLCAAAAAASGAVGAVAGLGLVGALLRRQQGEQVRPAA